MRLNPVAWGADMCASDCSSEEGEREFPGVFAIVDALKPMFSMRVGRASTFPDGGPQGGASRRQVAESLEAQERLRRELDRTHEAYRKGQAAQAKRILELEAETRALHRALEGERERIRLARTAREHVPAHGSPPTEILLRPLVLRSRQGEYLGVTDAQGTPLTLSGLIRLVEVGWGADRVVASFWDEEAGGWSLSFGVISAGHCCSYVLRVRPMRTPSGNRVAVLMAMRVGGAPVPHVHLVRMFRQLRECFQQE